MKQSVYSVFAGLMFFLIGCSEHNRDNPLDPGGVSYRPVSAGMRRLSGGTFQMGSTSGRSNEQPVNSITISSFWIDTTDVTQEDYASLMSINPSWNQSGLNPVEEVTWFDAVLYCNARSKRDGLDTVYSFTSISGVPGDSCYGLANCAIDFSKSGYRLPTEAEWEYACRAGTTTAYYWGSSLNGDYCWYYANSYSTTHPVAQKRPNAWGLYDMTGNAWEWCNDWYAAYSYGAQTDPTGPATGTWRSLRGGSNSEYSDTSDYLRSASRNSLFPYLRYSDVGFRCVRRYFAPPAAPELISPVNGTTNVSTSPAFSWWDTAGNAGSYHIQVSDSSSFTSMIFEDSTVTGTSDAAGSLTGNTTYYWRVRGKNTGGAGSWSPTWSFTTTGSSPYSPASPVLSSPFYGATGIVLNPTLYWSAASGAASYRMQISTNSNFATIWKDSSGITGDSITIRALTGSTAYYWRVDASNYYGTSAWSSTWYFTTQSSSAAPAAPVLSSPTNGSTNISTASSLAWNTTNGASTYRVQVSTSSSFNVTAIDDSTVTGTSKSLSSLAGNTTYYWRVNAKNAGGTSAWAGPWCFTTQNVSPPSTPSLFSPSYAATNISPTPTLTWSTVTGAATYRVQVSTGSTFTVNVLDDSTVTAGSRAIATALSGTTTYYWRVNAKNAGGTSAWVGPWYFTTQTVSVPATPTLSAPAIGSTVYSLTPAVTWATVSGASTYHVQISTAPSFTSLALDDSTVTKGCRTATQLTNNTTYYWRVNAKNSGGTSAWSSTGYFTAIQRFVTVGSGGTILTSADGITWTGRTSGTTGSLYGIAYGNNQFVAIGYYGVILTSSDGTTWSTSGSTNYLAGITYGNNRFVAVGGNDSGNGVILTSPDGIAWTGSSFGSTNYFNGIVYGNNQFVAVGDYGVILTSSDGNIWTSKTSGTSNNLNGIVYGNNQFVVVGSNGVILTSPDGLTWTSMTSGTSYSPNGITYGSNQFIAVGPNGVILTSSSGIAWTSRTSGTTNSLYGISYGNNLFVAVGGSGVILTSPDGITWTNRTSGTTNNLNGVK